MSDPATTAPPGAVVVTGGSGGIGAAICERLARFGRPLVVTYHHDVDGATATARRACEAGAPWAGAHRLDVTDSHAVDALMADTARTHGGIGVLVNNAAIGNASAVLPGNPVSQWTEVVQVNLIGTFHCIRAVSLHMLVAGAGSIVNIASIAGLSGIPGLSSYCASKAGVLGMTRSLSREFGPRGVRVNAVAPGYTDDTGMVARIDDDRLAGFVHRTALGRLGRPAEIAAAVAHLASDDTRFVTGQTLVVDGGLTA